MTKSYDATWRAEPFASGSQFKFGHHSWTILDIGVARTTLRRDDGKLDSIETYRLKAFMEAQ